MCALVSVTIRYWYRLYVEAREDTFLGILFNMLAKWLEMHHALLVWIGKVVVAFL